MSNSGPPASSRHTVLTHAAAVVVSTKNAGWKPAVLYGALS